MASEATRRSKRKLVQLEMNDELPRLVQGRSWQPHGARTLPPNSARQSGSREPVRPTPWAWGVPYHDEVVSGEPRGQHFAMTILETITDAFLFGAIFRGSSWDAWRAFLAATLGLPMSAADAALYRAHTGRETPPTTQAREA